MRCLSIGTHASSLFNSLALLFKLSFAGATEIENLFSSDFNERATSIIDLQNCLFSQDLGKNA